MVHQNQDGNEAGWIDEGLSELSSSLNGYLDLGFAPEFMAAPETQLNTWAEGQRSIPHYGASYTFASYYFQRYGADGVKDLMANKVNGLENYRAALQEVKATDPSTNKPVTLEDLFSDWTTTNLLNDPRVGDGRYSYSRFKTHLATPAMQTISPTETPQALSTNQWGTLYLKLDKPGKYRFTFDGQPTVKAVPADAHGGKMMWWIHRDDRSDTGPTQSVDPS